MNFGTSGLSELSIVEIGNVAKISKQVGLR